MTVHLEKRMEAKSTYSVNGKNEKNLQEQSGKEKKLCQRIKHVTSLITVEPIIVCYFIPFVISNLATQNLYLEKACRVNLRYEEHICDALTQRDAANYTYEEAEVQKLVAFITGWKTILQSFLPCVILIFLGAYSDRIGQRKFCMLLPLIGEFFASLVLVANTYFFYELPAEAVAVTSAIFPALTGGSLAMFLGAFSYIVDVTTVEQRTLRVGILTSFNSIGLPVGLGLSGILVSEIGFYGVYFFNASLYFVGFIYAYFRITEVKKLTSEENSKNCCHWLRNFFDPRCVRDAVSVTFKRGSNSRRLRVIMLAISLCLIVGPVQGELSVTYLSMRYRFNWNEVEFSIYAAYATFGLLAGSLLCVSIFSRVLKIHDAIIGIIGCTSKILSTFMFAFAVTPWQIYIAPLIDIFGGTPSIAMRSIISKTVSKDELGKVNSLFGVAEAVVPLVCVPLYTTVYRLTINSLPGAFYLLSGALILPALLIFTSLYIISKKIHKKELRNLAAQQSELNVQTEEK